MLLSLLWPDSWLKFLLVWNAILGAIIFNLIWKVTPRFRQPNHLLEKGATAMYRRDAKRWSYPWLLCGSLFIGLPRTLAVLFSVIALCIFVTICSLGTSVTKDKYYSGIRRYLIRNSVWLVCWLIIKIVNIRIEKTDLTQDDIDYSYYLGPDYIAAKFTDRVSKIMPNHSSCFHIHTLFNWHKDETIVRISNLKH